MKIKKLTSVVLFNTETITNEDWKMTHSLPLTLDEEVYNRLPLSLKLLSWRTAESDLAAYAAWLDGERRKVATKANNLWFQDYTGIPEINTLAAQRSALADMGADSTVIKAQVKTWMVIDHSAATWSSNLAENVRREYELNGDRYALAKWSATELGIEVVPPGKGVIHQVNTERLVRPFDEEGRPNFGKGTDSHSPMVNCLGYLGWGVGGTEAMQVFAGKSIQMALPEVYGVRLRGELPLGVNASDLALYLKKVLREVGVTGSFVEIFGEGVDTLSLESRATIANVAAEFGSRVAMFGIDEETIRFLALSGRETGVEELAKAYGLWRTKESEEDVVRTRVIDVDLTSIEIGISGPDKPHNWVPLTYAKEHVSEVFRDKGLEERDFKSLVGDNEEISVPNGALLLASIASCTQTANPEAVLRAALFARNAVKKGLSVKPWVKTAFAAGSPVAREYLIQLGLVPALAVLGFEISAFGCGACIGQSGGLNEVGKDLISKGLTGTSIVSANRNYAGRQDASIGISFLGRPDLVVAYAIAGRMDIDLVNYDFGDGITLQDLMPSDREIAEATGIIGADMYTDAYGNLFEGDEHWNAVEAPVGPVYTWPSHSLTVAKPVIFDQLKSEPDPVKAISGGRTLFIAGDSFSTDAISPAGDPKDIPATMEYLKSQGVTDPESILSIGGYRSNDDVLNTTILSNPTNQNLMVSQKGGWTVHYPSGDEVVVFEAARRYRNEGVSQVIIGGRDYGCGSSRVMAASGPAKLGVKAVIAESFEAIHRSNLWQWGVAALTFREGENAETFALTGDESWNIWLNGITSESTELDAEIIRSDGQVVPVTLQVALESGQEFEFFRHGGAVRMQMRDLAQTA